MNMKIIPMRNLIVVTTAIFCLAGLIPQSQGADSVKVAKERMVLMPLRVGEEDKMLHGAMETALVQGLQQKYEVFSGEQVAQKAREIFLKESRSTSKKECDETRCMQGIAEAFQAELIATANVTKRDDGYFLALSVQNIFDNLVVYSNSIPCRNCDAYMVVDRLKELSGASVSVLPPIEPFDVPVAAANKASEPETALWNEVKSTNLIEDYQLYLAQYPKGRYVALANTYIKKIQDDAAKEAARKDQLAWQAAEKAGGELNYQDYLKAYPQGKYVNLAQARIKKIQGEAFARKDKLAWDSAEKSGKINGYDAYIKDFPSGSYINLAQIRVKKLHAEQAAREEEELWQQVQNSDSSDVGQEYLDKYPGGSHVKEVQQKVAVLRESERMKRDNIKKSATVLPSF